MKKNINLFSIDQNTVFQLKYFLLNKKMNGPAAVFNSVLRSLKKLNIQYSVNDKENNFNIAWVLSGIDYLKFCLDNRDKYDYLIVGPNITNMPYDHKEMTDTNIDLHIVPCNWVKEAYSEFIPEDKIYICPSGVDIEYWKPDNSTKSDVIIYNKINNELLINQTIKILENAKYRIQIFNYGKYNQKEFKKALNTSIFSIFFSISESQGLSMFESWSMNVPTIVWQSNIFNVNHFKYKSISCSPYLHNKNGIFFEDLKELDKIIENFALGTFRFNPRKWLIDNYLEEKIIKELLSKIKRN